MTSGFESINREINNRMHEIATKISKRQETDREREELAALIYPKLKYHIWKFCRNEYDTEEALHYTLAKIFSKLDKFKPEEGRFTTWAFTLARNETLYYLDRKDRALPKNYTEITSVFGKVNDVHSSKYDQSKYDTIQLVYDMAISEINRIEDETLRNIATDKMINQDKIKEIAIRYEMNENTVKTKLRKARKDIKDNILNTHPDLKELINDAFKN